MLLSTPTPEENRRPHVVPLAFWTEYEPDPANPGEMRAVDFVKWGRRGDLHYSANVEKITRLQRPMKMLDDHGRAVPNPVWEAIKDAYMAWKQGQETPANGTPLEAWPALNSAQVKVLREQHYRSVEDVAAMTDAEIPRIRLPGVRQLRDMARAYVEAKKGQAHIEKALAERDAEIADLRNTIAELTAALKQMQQQQAGPRPGDPMAPAAPAPEPPPPQRRGRMGNA